MFTRIIHSIPVPRLLLLPCILALVGTPGPAKGGEPSPATDGPAAVQAADEGPAPITPDDVDRILRALGHSPRRKVNTKFEPTGPLVDHRQDGRTVPLLNWRRSMQEFLSVDLHQDDQTVTACFTVADRGRVRIDADLLPVDASLPPKSEVLLGLLAKQDSLWPAYVNYSPASRVMQLVLEVDSFNETGMRQAIQCFAKKWTSLKPAVAKVSAQNTATGSPQGSKPAEAGGQNQTVKTSGTNPGGTALRIGEIFRSAEGRFQARFPATPKEFKQKVGPKGMEVEQVVTIWSNPADTLAYFVSWSPLSPVNSRDKKTFQKFFLDNIKNEFRSRSTKFVSFQPETPIQGELALGVIQTEMLVDGQPFSYLTHYVVQGDRLYQVMVGAAKPEDLDSAQVRDFISSFRFIPDAGFLVRPEGGGFEARFPEKPEGELEKVRNPNLPHFYVLDTGSTLHLISFQYVLGEQVHQNDEAKLDAAAQQLAEGELLCKKRTTFSAAKMPMIDMTYRNEKGYIRYWIILDRDRIFTLAYGSRQEKDLDSVNCREFLKSFRIIGSRTSNQD